MKLPAGIQSWGIPSFGEILIASGVDVACGTGGRWVLVGAEVGVDGGAEVGINAGIAAGAG